MLLILLIPAGGLLLFLNLHPLFLKDDTIELELQGSFDPAENIRYVFGGNADQVRTEGSADLAKPGDYTVTYIYKKYRRSVTVRVQDTIPPELDLHPYTADLTEEITPEKFVEKMLIQGMGAKELSCGYDFTFGKGGAGTTETLCRVAERHGVKVNVVEPVTLDGEPVSSTRIRQAILEGKMDEASRMLGRRFCLRLKVEHGNCIGRLLDFPTINQSFPQHHIVPRYGVYSTVVNVAGKLYGGVTNVGVKPTVGSDRPLSETYILDYSGDLYGQTVEVYFFRFVRPEQKFGSIAELKEQIARDKEDVAQEVAQNIEQMLFLDSRAQEPATFEKI